MLRFVGVTAIVRSVAAVTVTVVAPEVAPSDAEIEAEPTVAPVTSPWLPAALETLATAGLDEAQVTCWVTSCVVPSEYEPVAASWSVVPRASDELGGVT